MNSELKKPELLKLAENTGMVNVDFHLFLSSFSWEFRVLPTGQPIGR